jgi:hypothetical protein
MSKTTALKNQTVKLLPARTTMQTVTVDITTGAATVNSVNVANSGLVLLVPGGA